MRLSGNLKCDRLFQDRDEAEAAGNFNGCCTAARQLPGASLVWLAASTHAGRRGNSAGRLQGASGPLPFSCSWSWRPGIPSAPRAWRDNLVGAKYGLPCHLWSRLKAGLEVRTQPVVLIDTIGDLFSLYGAADVAFVGGSLGPPWWPKYPGGRGLGPGAPLWPQPLQLPLGPGHPGS